MFGYDVNMPNPRLVPDKAQMEAYLKRKLTQQQIVDEWEKDSGVRVSRSAIGLAIERYGLKSATTRPRWERLIPWQVKPEHQQAKEVRLLRLEARRGQGLPLSDRDLKRLENWKRELAEANAVIHYHPDTDKGFFWVPREEGDGHLIREPEKA